MHVLNEYLAQLYITNAEFQDVCDHACLCWSYGRQAGGIFTLLGDSGRARCHSRFRPAIRLEGWLTSKVNERPVCVQRTGRKLTRLG